MDGLSSPPGYGRRSIRRLLPALFCRKSLGSNHPPLPIHRHPASHGHFRRLPFIEALASGLDPVTGDVLPEDSPLHHPQVIRALFTATRLIESQCVSALADSNNSRPTRAGEPWDKDEDQKLAHAFHAGEPFSHIAEIHQRSRGAIVSRLVRLGCIQRKSSTNTDSPLPAIAHHLERLKLAFLTHFRRTFPSSLA